MKYVWKILTFVFISFNVFMLLTCVYDFFDVIVTNCANSFPHMGCPWRAESMGWPWLSSRVYFVVILTNVLLFGMFTIFSVNKLKYRHYGKACIMAFLPIPVLFTLNNIVDMLYYW